MSLTKQQVRPNRINELIDESEFLESLRALLYELSWREVETDNPSWLTFVPPMWLNFSESYLLWIPNDEGFFNDSSKRQKYLDILLEIYL